MWGAGGVGVGRGWFDRSNDEQTKSNKTYKKVMERKAVTVVLDFVRARATCLEFAVFALKDVPVWSGMAHRAHPLNKCRLGLKKVERMVAITR